MKILRWTLPFLLTACGGDSGIGILALQLTAMPVDSAPADTCYNSGAGASPASWTATDKLRSPPPPCPSTTATPTTAPANTPSPS